MVEIYEASYLCGVVSSAVLKSDTFAGIWGFPKMVVPKNHGFPAKIIILGWRLGVPPFKETPI